MITTVSSVYSTIIVAKVRGKGINDLVIFLWNVKGNQLPHFAFS